MDQLGLLDLAPSSTLQIVVRRTARTRHKELHHWPLVVPNHLLDNSSRRAHAYTQRRPERDSGHEAPLAPRHGVHTNQRANAILLRAAENAHGDFLHSCRHRRAATAATASSRRWRSRVLFQGQGLGKRIAGEALGQFCQENRISVLLGTVNLALRARLVLLVRKKELAALGRHAQVRQEGHYCRRASRDCLVALPHLARNHGHLLNCAKPLVRQSRIKPIRKHTKSLDQRLKSRICRPSVGRPRCSRQTLRTCKQGTSRRKILLYSVIRNLH